MRARRHTYTAYSVGCGAVWAVILVLTQRRADAERRKAMQLFCAAWWSGWTSATIARVSYPPAKKLGPRAEKRLRNVAVALIALGVGNVVRFVRAPSGR